MNKSKKALSDDNLRIVVDVRPFSYSYHENTKMIMMNKSSCILNPLWTSVSVLLGVVRLLSSMKLQIADNNYLTKIFPGYF